MPANHNGLCKAVSILIEAQTGRFGYGRKADSTKVGFRRIRCDAIHSESSARCGTTLSGNRGILNFNFFSRSALGLRLASKPSSVGMRESHAADNSQGQVDPTDSRADEPPRDGVVIK